MKEMEINNENPIFLTNHLYLQNEKIFIPFYFVWLLLEFGNGFMLLQLLLVHMNSFSTLSWYFINIIIIIFLVFLSENTFCNINHDTL